MENKAKIRINLNSREFEIEGSEEFINSHSVKIDNFLELLKNSPIPAIVEQPIISNQVANTNKPIAQSNSEMPDNFGEYYHQIPKTAKDSDKMLIAGHFAQQISSENSFGTKDATTLLLDQGVKLSNPSMFLTQNVKTKYIIKLTKGKFRVSKSGTEHIQKLLSGDEE